MAINQTQIKNFETQDIASLKLVKGRDKEIIFCVETETSYMYTSNGGALTPNDTSVVVTVNGGNTRWVAVFGRYTYTKEIVAQQYVKEFDLNTWQGASAPYSIEILATEHQVTNDNRLSVTSFETTTTNENTLLYFEITNSGDVTLYSDIKFVGYSILNAIGTGAVLGVNKIDGGDF